MRSMLTSCSTKRFPNPSKGNDRSAKHPFVKRDMITCVRKRPIGFGVLFCENNGVPSKRGSVKKWETSVGPRCLSNGSTSSPRAKIECSQRATLIMIGNHNRIQQNIEKNFLRIKIECHITQRGSVLDIIVLGIKSYHM